MENTYFKELLNENIENQWRKYEYYRNICAEKKKSLEDLKSAVSNEEYYEIPGIISTAFKKSRNLVKELNDLSVPGLFQVSSSTSGDPSYIYTSMHEIERITNNYKLTFGIEGVSSAIGFAPSLRIMDGLSKKAGYLGKKSVLRMKLALEGGKNHYDQIDFTVDISIIKTLFSMLFKGSPVLIKKTKEEVIEFIKKIENKGNNVAIGGFVLLLSPYLDELKENSFKLGKNGFVVFSGGGYGGNKGSIVGKKINKPEFIKRIGSVFGIEKKYWATNIKDIYAFTESSATHEGFWNTDIDDFVFESWHESKIFIVDPETEKPLKKGSGLLKIIMPYAAGDPSSANVSIVQKDMAEIIEVDENFVVKKFSHIKRFGGSSLEGCGYKADEIANK